MYRSSTGALDRFDEEPPRGGERWDRDRFERAQREGNPRTEASMRGGSARGGGSIHGGNTHIGSIPGGSMHGGNPHSGSVRDEHEHFRFQEHDRFPGGRRDIDIHEDRDRRGPPVLERERPFEDDRFKQPARRQNNLFDDYTPSEIVNQALAPYRRGSVVDREININKKVDIDVGSRRRPSRPQFIRRQSSLDTFDRRPLPRYGDAEKDEYRPPANVPIPLPFRERHISPPRRFRDEDEVEDYRLTERTSRGRDRDDYREVEVHREKSRVRRSKSVAKSTRSSSRSSSEESRVPRSTRSKKGRDSDDYREVEIHREKSRVRKSKSVAKSTRSSSRSSSEEPQLPRATWGKKGRTRLPKRLAKKDVVIELGYPFEEEDDFIIITRALEKDHIDEVIKMSEKYKEVEKTTYVYEEKVETLPPPPASIYDAPPPPASVHAHSVHAQSVHAQSVHGHQPPPPPLVYAQPPPASVYAPQPPPSAHAPPPSPSHYAQSHYAASHYAQSVREPSPPKHEHQREEYIQIERSNAIHGPATAFLPEARQLVRRDDRRSEREIREEIRMLEEERRMLKYEREGELVILERREPKREVVRVDRDRKGRRTKDRPNPKIIAAMIGTLS